jgi:hypothetical protein
MNSIFDFKKLYKYIIMFAIGIILILNGLISLSMDATSSRRISDDEVIKRAKALGLVDLKEEYLKINNNDRRGVDKNTKTNVNGE